MSDHKMKLTYEQVAFIVEKIGISDPQKAFERFAELMKLEGISPRKLPLVVQKLMERERRGQR